MKRMMNDDKSNPHHQKDKNTNGTDGGVYYSSFTCVPVILIVAGLVYLCLKRGYCKPKSPEYDRVGCDRTECSGRSSGRNHDGYLEFEELDVPEVNTVSRFQPPSYSRVITTGFVIGSQPAILTTQQATRRDPVLLNPHELSDNQHIPAHDRHCVIDMNIPEQTEESLPNYDVAVRQMNKTSTTNR